MGRFGDNRRGGFSRGRSSGSRYGSGRGIFGRDSGRGGRGRDGRRPLEMHDAVCDKCGEECRVPFRPTGNKPVLCSDCYRESRQGRDSGRDRGQSGMSSVLLNQINAKLDKIIKALDIDSDEGEEEIEEETEEQ